MKKFIKCIIVSCFALSLTACGASAEDSAKKSVDSFMNAVLNYDADTAKTYLASDDLSDTFGLSSLDYSSLTSAGVSEDTVKKYLDVTKQVYDQNYAIGEVKKNSDTECTVKVTISARNSDDVSEIVQKYYAANSANYPDLLSGDAQTAYDSLVTLYSDLVDNEDIKAVTEESNEGTFTVQKTDKKWLISAYEAD